ncbi:MAG TPA: enoyl-CoA hydratase-related protein [Parvularculaceae bacterium]|nr:enoyl-CoA hydratase-related protein [Parvularculaceae bacterium]
MTLPQPVDILLERRKSTLIATLNRPQAKNALNAAIVDSLFSLCDWLNENRDIRAFVLRGAGGTFCAGGDIKEFASQLMASDPAPGEADPVEKGNRRFGDLLLKLDALPQVVVSVIEGAAFGGAMGFVATSDVAIAASDAKFSLSETTLGLPPAQIGPFVVRKIGLFNARRLALTGARFVAEEASRVGLVDLIVAPNDIERALTSTLNDIGRCEPGAIAATKRIVNNAARSVDPRELDAAAKEFAKCLRGAGRIGAAAFAQKQAPSWVQTYLERSQA